MTIKEYRNRVELAERTLERIDSDNPCLVALELVSVLVWLAPMGWRRLRYHPAALVLMGRLADLLGFDGSTDQIEESIVVLRGISNSRQGDTSHVNSN